MNTASLELCKELYELSGWHDCEFLYARGGALAHNSIKDHVPDPVFSDPPAYDLGYLLRKLPAPYFLQLGVVKEWRIAYQGGDGIYADTPEDAACKLAIELFKQGVLK